MRLMLLFSSICCKPRGIRELYDHYIPLVLDVYCFPNPFLIRAIHVSTQKCMPYDPMKHAKVIVEVMNP